MNRQILHNQLRHRLDDLVEKHQEFTTRTDSIPSGEMTQFLADIRLVYELSLALHHQNAIRSMEDLEVAVAQRFTGDVKNEEPAPTPAETPHSMEQVLVDAINRTEEEMIHAAKNPLRITGDVQGLFEPQESIADQFKESVTLAETVAAKSSTSRVAESLKNTRINDLTTAIGINERFYYIQHLFGGNAGVYHLTLERLNKETDRNAAMDYIHKEVSGKFGWDTSSQAVRNFIELIERKFNA